MAGERTPPSPPVMAAKAATHDQSRGAMLGPPERLDPEQRRSGLRLEPHQRASPLETRDVSVAAGRAQTHHPSWPRRRPPTTTSNRCVCCSKIAVLGTTEKAHDKTHIFHNKYYANRNARAAGRLRKPGGGARHKRRVRCETRSRRAGEDSQSGQPRYRCGSGRAPRRVCFLQDISVCVRTPRKRGCHREACELFSTVHSERSGKELISAFTRPPHRRLRRF